MYEKPRYLPAGDIGIVVELGDSISPEINRKVRNLTVAIEQNNIPGVFDLMPTYRSVLVYYDPLATSFDSLRDSIDALQDNLSDESVGEPQVIHVPTLYGGDYGPDIEFVAKHAGISVDEVIAIHSSTDYLIYMMGFAPGFSYLGGLSKKLVTPRLTSPRTEIPAGSVGIAESQTGIYPIASPGGWQLIGRTPLKMFDPARESPVLLNPGDYVRFDPLESEAEYNRIRSLAEEGRYQIVTSSPA